MKKLISRALTLVVIAGTISNTTHCRIPKADVNKAAQFTKEVTAKNTAVVQAKDNNAPQKDIEAKEEAAKKAADKARTWLDSVPELSGTTKLLLGAIAITGALVGVDYGVAYYTKGKMGGYTAAGLNRASTLAKPYMEQARAKVSSAASNVWNKLPGRPSWFGGTSTQTAADQQAAANIQAAADQQAAADAANRQRLQDAVMTGFGE